MSNQGWFAWFSSCFGEEGPNNLVQEPNVVTTPAVYFGCPLQVIYNNQDQLELNVPLPLYQTAEALQNSLTIEGLFRISGGFGEMQRMKDRYETKSGVNLQESDSIHSVAGLLEKWLRELPEPLTTHMLYDDLMGCTGPEILEEECIKNIEKCITRLPECNKVSLAFVLRLLNQVSQHADENMMCAKNLGTCFGTVLLGSAVFTFSLDMKQKIKEQNTIAQTLIENVETFFPNYEYPF